MSDIIVRVSELSTIVKDIRRSGSEFVLLSVVEDADESFLSLSACKGSDTDTWIDFDSIDAVENEKELEEKNLYGTHISSNML